MFSAPEWLPPLSNATTSLGPEDHLAAGFSSSANNWIVVILIGAFLSGLRELWGFAYQYIHKYFFLEAHFDEKDESYEWVISWLSNQPSWNSMRDFQISTWSWFDTRNAVTLEEDEAEENKASRRLSYLPSLYGSYHLLYRGCWVRVSRTQSQSGFAGRMEQSIHISVLTRDPNFILDMLKDARRQFVLSQDDKLWIYTNHRSEYWDFAGSREKRSMESIVLDPGIKDLLLADAQDFLRSKEWYRRRGIPFRRGYLLYGPPGSGKTSVIQAVAGELKLNIYIISLSAKDLDDSTLAQLLNRLPERSVVLMEDIDAAFKRGVTKRETESEEEGNSKGVTLSGLLNALDGVGSKEGRILFATTNHYEKLDSALTRPGRMDLHIQFSQATKTQAKDLFLEFYLLEDNVHGGRVTPAASTTAEKTAPADAKGSSNDDPTDGREIQSDLEVEPATPESATLAASSSTSTENEKDTIEMLLSAVLKKIKKNSASAESSLKTAAVTTTTTTTSNKNNNNTRKAIKGAIHTERLSAKLTKDALEELSGRFSDAIPDEKCSMAALQGYLMTYKSDPAAAVANITGWVEKQVGATEEVKEDRWVKKVWKKRGSMLKFK